MSETEEAVVEKRNYPVMADLGPNIPTFEDYFAMRLPVIKETQAILAQALSSDPLEMEQQIRQAEAKLAVLKCTESFSNAYLDVAEHLELSKLPPRSQTYTDMDRNKALAAACVRYRRFRDICVALIESIETRISYGQSRLRFIEKNNG